MYNTSTTSWKIDIETFSADCVEMQELTFLWTEGSTSLCSIILSFMNNKNDCKIINITSEI